MFRGSLSRQRMPFWARADKVQVFWPVHAAPFRLQSSSNGRFTGWANVPNSVSTQGGINNVVILTEDKNVNYRLIYDW